MDIIIPYKPRELQQEFHNNRKRWNFLLCHRRFGKTVMTTNELIKQALLCKKERPRFAYIAPTFRMAKNIVWDYLKHYSNVVPSRKFNESELRVDFPNGARIQLLGAENIDSLRGIYLDGVILDEYAQIRPSLFTEVIRPALSDREGFAVFIGTPKGKNHFYDLYNQVKNKEDWYVKTYKSSSTHYVAEQELKAAEELMTKDEYLQEYECSWDAAIKGAFYADDLDRAKTEQRICKVPYDNNLPVHTSWDIGFRDDTAIIFFQLFGKEVRIIDYYSNSGMTVADYAKILQDKGYQYGDHYFPWDAKIKPMSSGKSTIDVARDYGIIAKLTPSLSVLDGINQARLLFNRCWFDDEKAADLLNCLSSYRREYNDKNQTFRANPLHDWSSHGADSFRYACISIKKDIKRDEHEDLDAYEQYINAPIIDNTF